MVNGTEFIDSPWNEIMSPFTELLGSGFYLIPLSFIAVALYMKTRDTTVVSAYLLATGVLLSSGSIFTGYIEMAFVYVIFSAIGIVGLIASLFFMRR